MANKSSNTASPEIQPEQASPEQASPDQPSNTLTLSPLSAFTPAIKRDPTVQKDGDTIRIDY